MHTWLILTKLLKALLLNSGHKITVLRVRGWFVHYFIKTLHPCKFNHHHKLFEINPREILYGDCQVELWRPSTQHSGQGPILCKRFCLDNLELIQFYFWLVKCLKSVCRKMTIDGELLNTMLRMTQTFRRYFFYLLGELRDLILNFV